MALASGGSATAVSLIGIDGQKDRIRLLLQVHTSPYIAADNQFKGVMDMLTRVPKEQLAGAPWRGILANIIKYLVDKKKDSGKFYAGNLASGAAAGAASLSFVYPLDYARTRLVADIGKAGNREFKGLADCILKIIKSDGLFGIYRGFVVSVQGVIINRSFYFGAYDTIKTMFGKQLNFLEAWFLAMCVTANARILSYPMDTVRRRMMMQSGRKDVLYKNSWDCAQKIINNEGALAMIKGCHLHVHRLTGGAVALALYDEIQKYL